MAGRSLERAVAALAEGGVVAFTGAGISADSGVPTFRDPGGLWDRFDPERFGTWEGLAAEAMAHPDRLADFLGELRASFGSRGARARRAAHRRDHAERGRPAPGGREPARRRDPRVPAPAGVLGVRHRGPGHPGGVPAGLGPGHRRAADRLRPEPGVGPAPVPRVRRADPPGVRRVRRAAPAVRGGVRPGGDVRRDAGGGDGRRGGEPAATLPRLARTAGAPVVHVGAGETLVEADVDLRGRAARILPDLVRRAVAGARAR